MIEPTSPSDPIAVLALYDRLLAQRDEVLARIDTGQRHTVTASERVTLEAITGCLDTIYPAVLAAEHALVARARQWVERHPETGDRYAHAQRWLLQDAPRGRWDDVVAVARAICTEITTE